MFEELRQIVEISGKNNCVLSITAEGEENTIFFDEKNKKITINFVDHTDETFQSKMTEQLKYLQNFFN
jgi:hypothetical protein